MSEIALVSSRKFKLENSAKKGNKNAQKALELADNPNTFLSTVQIGITLIGILTGVYSGEKLTNDLSRLIAGNALLAPYSESVAVFLVVLILTYFSIVFGELIPKRIGLTFPETIASLVARPMNAVSIATKPFIWLLGATNDFFLRLFGINEKKDGIVSEEEIKSIIAESTSVGEIQEIEQDIVKRVFALGDRRAGELMTHRSDLVCIDINEDLEQIRKKTQEYPHAVYPVIDKTPDKLLGTITVHKIFTQNASAEDFEVRKLMDKAFYVQENLAAYKVLEKFKEHKIHLVVVVDEYGSIEGVLSVTDVVDALIGEVSMGTTEDFSIIQRDENSWLVDGQLPYYELVDYLQLEDVEEPEGFTTLAGLFLSKVNHYPITGERIQWMDFELEIVDMDERRIDKVLISRIT